MKEKWMDVSVSAEQALKYCLEQKTKAFCVEGPLYNRLKDRLFPVQDHPDYDVIDYPEKEIILMKLARGSDKFDDEHFEIYYYPFEDQNGENK